MPKTLEQALEECNALLEAQGVVYIILVQRLGTRQTTGCGNVERTEAPTMLREAIRALESN